MNMIKIRSKQFFGYLDPVNVVLALFIIVTGFFIFHQNQINLKVKSFNYYVNTISKLKILNNDFDSFINMKTSFVDYDELITKINETYTLIDILKKDEFYDNFGNEFKDAIIELEEKWHKKARNIERFKSANAFVVGTFNYVLELSSQIKKESFLNQREDFLVLDESIRNILKLFVNEKNINEDKLFELSIFDQLKNLEDLSKKTREAELEFLHKRLSAIVNNLIKINLLKVDFKSFDFKKDLENIEENLELVNSKNLDHQQIFAIVLFVISIILLIILIYAYYKSVRTKTELKAFRYAVENSDNSIVMTDKNRNITYVNESFENITGYKREEVLGKNPNILKSGKLNKEFYSKMNKTLDSGEKWMGEFVNIDKNQEVYYETASITPIFNGKELTGYLAIKLNVTDYVKEQEKVEFLAYHDSLTLLPNRRSLERKVKDLLEKSLLYKNKFSIFFIDLDGFKFINDGLGHDVGDELLKKLGLKFKELFKETDSVFRIGGDEFAVLFYYEDEKTINKNAEKIIRNVNEKIIIKNHSLHVGCSIGIARYPDDATTLVNLLKYSDTAMYKAKQKGKNRYEFYTQDLSATVSRRFEIEQAFPVGLKKSEFSLVYQPKYSMKSKETFSVEALLRWDSSILGKVNPEDFIFVAEEMGFIYELGLFVFKQACEDFRKLENKLGIKMITINISTVQLMQDDFIERVKEILFETNVQASSVGIEITETYLIKNIDEIEISLTKLQKLGFKILIDDFGTGYSSLQYLQRLPIDIIKIDRSFVSNLTNKNKEIIKAIVAISQSFGYKTIAEGIETKEQEDILLALGIDFGQGFLFSKPKSLIEFN